ncbi:MAG: hypothetical protein JW957_07105 [Candidatus Omnitrophica bacterium]|nr:hypothetical protein [Candidatus Omnitrophota bacterium]
MDKISNRKSGGKKFVLAAMAVTLLFGVLTGESSGAYRWHTFYGGAAEDRGRGIAVDAAGSMYVVGYSKDSWTGPGGENPLNAHSGTGSSLDIFILKLASDGSYLWHTFYGSLSGADYGYDVAVNGTSVYVTGFSMASWNGPAAEAPKNSPADSNWNIVVLKLASDGSYGWHTFYGSDGEDEGQSLVLDADENVYIAGISDNSWTGPAGQAPLKAHAGERDIMVLNIDSNGTYQWHTFYGSVSAVDEGFSVAGDGNNNLFIAGQSSAAWTGPAGQAPLHAYSLDKDITVLKIDSNGAYQWHTFYGAPAGEEGRGIAVDAAGSVYVAGNGAQTWTGPAGQNPLHPWMGSNDIMVLKLNNSGAYRWHTFYGSDSAADYGNAVKVYGNSDVYVAGRSHATWQGDDGANPLNGYAGSSDFMILKLNVDGEYQWHTFYGGLATDRGQALALDDSGNTYIAGYSEGSWDGASGELPLNSYTGNRDIAVLSLESTIAGRCRGGGNCFIATAAYGSPLAVQVEILRRFRDRHLLTNTAGRKFVNWYYEKGHVAAGYISTRPAVRFLAGVALYPVVGIAWLAMHGIYLLLIIAAAGLYAAIKHCRRTKYFAG